ncbi:chondroitin sulfate synthase 1-like isoform X1 [Clavelina lepadiformis]|uniref:chondroitin sulfate synthase 1-like isoform X1 n=2 Tax=Clavelina lepadiformis TaxID=159417 RepID=UPI0040422224
MKRQMVKLFGVSRYHRRMLMSPTLDLEKSLYRFILGGVIGFLLGVHFLPEYHLGITHNVHSNKPCATIGNDGAAITTAFRKTTEKVKHDRSQRSTGNIYIGMMSMSKRLNTRVASAIHSWMKHRHVTVEVFADTNGTKDERRRYVSSDLENDVRIIQLPGVSDNVYPPQKKSFSMLKFIHDAYINDYDWFVRLDDDAYVNTEKLEKFLNRINSSIPMYIGNAGFGRDTDDFISPGENYCMGGPGMIFSKALLRKLGPKLGTCLMSLLTEHEDIELGRCVQKTTGIKCTDSWETRRLFFQNYQDGTYGSNIHLVTPKQIDEGLIFHANKESTYQYNFHAVVLKRKIAQLVDRVTQLEKDLRKNFKNEEDTHDLGSSSYSQFRWNSIVRSNIYKIDERNLNKRMHPTLKNVLIDNTNKFVSQYDYKKDIKHAKLKAVSLELSYHVVNPTLSMDAISLLVCSFVPSSATYSGLVNYKDRTKTISIYQRQYITTRLHFMDEPYELETLVIEKQAQMINKVSNLKKWDYLPISSTPKVAVYFLMALSGRPENFVRFLKNFEETFLNKGENVHLIVTFFPEELKSRDAETNDAVIVNADSVRRQEMLYEEEAAQHNAIKDDVHFIKQNLRSLQDSYPHARLEIVLTKPGTEFSRGVGLQTASEQVTDANTILFFCDVDLVFAPELLIHIRRNSIQGKTVYYPVFFSQYDPDVVYVERPKPSTHFTFEELSGFWRYFSFGMLSLYKSDFNRTGGFDLSIHGWGLEDLHLVKAIQNAGLETFQSTEPAEVHIYHDKYCDPSTSDKQYSDCLNSRATHYGPKTLLYYLWKAPETAVDAVDNVEENHERNVVME